MKTLRVATADVTVPALIVADGRKVLVLPCVQIDDILVAEVNILLKAYAVDLEE